MPKKKREKEEKIMNIIELMEQKGTPSLKAIAMVFDLPAVRLYSTAKTPKEGEVYDAKKYNWEAVERFVVRRLGQSDMPSTLEEVIDKALEIDVELQAADGRRMANRGPSRQKIEVDGKFIDARRYANHEMPDDDSLQVLIALRKDVAVYKAVYQTVSHTVLVPVADEAGTIASQEVKVISNGMLNMRGFNAVANARGIEERFSGEYAKKLAAEESADASAEAAENEATAAE